MANKHFLAALDDAWETGRNFVDEMVEQFRDSGEISDDLNNDYPNGDAYHHESHVDKDYDLTEAAQLLDELDEWEETDSGLWEGLEPRRAIAAQAAYTYGAAVYDLWRRHVVEDLNEKLTDLKDSMSEARADAKAKAIADAAEAKARAEALPQYEDEHAEEPEAQEEVEEDDDEEDDDEEERYHTAGERLIRFVCLFGEDAADTMNDDERMMYKAALKNVLEGDGTAALAYADWLDEHDSPHKAKQIREIHGITEGAK